MADIYGRTIEYENTFDPMQSTASLLTISGAGLTGNSAAGYLVQDIGIQYSQDIQRIYELGSAKVYFIAGRPNGEFTIGKIAAPGTMISEFICKFGNPCKVAEGAGNNGTVDITAGNMWCKNRSANTGYSLYKLQITQTGVTVNAKEMLVGESLKGIFAELRWLGAGCSE